MSQNINPQHSKAATDNSMTKNQFTFKLDRPPENSSVMKNHFHLKFDKITKALGDAEPVYKPRKKPLPRPNPTETNAPNHITTHYHPYSSVSGTPSRLYTNASSPAFFTTAQNTNLLPSTHDLDASVAIRTKPALSPSAEKIKVSNLINSEMMDEKELDARTINTLTNVFR